MLSREERILSEILVARGIASRELIEKCARIKEASSADISLVDALVDSGMVARELAEPMAQEARAVDDALAPNLPGGERLGEFRLVREIGRGGMGVVFEAHQESLDRRVALKILPAGAALDERLAVRFLREARAAGRLRHPGIVSVITSGRAEGVLYFAMELVEGCSLAEELARGPIEPRRAAGLVAEVGGALDYAHGEGLIHRDIKPENVLLGADGRPRLTDFGLVHEVLAESFTLPHHVLGTPAYIPPEQALGAPPDRRSDIYSLGAVLYAVLCGRGPYDPGIPSAVLARVLAGPPATLAERRPDVPTALVRICERAMARRPEERYQRASELVDDLARFARGEALAAAPGRAGRVVTRTRMALLAAGAVALAGVILIASRWRPSREPLHPAVAPIASPLVFTLVNHTPLQKALLSIAPDGSRLAYMSRTGSTRWDVYVQDLPSGEPSCLSCGRPEGSTPAISPDGRSVAFGTTQDGRPALALASLADGTLRTIPSPTGALSWSPDGREIAVAYKSGVDSSPVSHGEAGRLAVVNLGSRRVRTLRNMNVTAPSWSPHGSRIAFTSLSGGQTDLWTVAPDGGGLLHVTDDAEPDWSPVWASGGTRLLFGSERNGRLGLWSIGVEESTGRPLGAPVAVSTAAFAKEFFSSMSADGRRLVVLETAEQGRLHRVPLDPARVAPAGPAVAFPRHPAVILSPDPSPDGRILVAQALSPQEDIAVMTSDGSLEPRFLTDDPFRDGAPRWSPLGDRIAFHSDRDGTMAIWTIRPDGSELRRYAGAPHGDALKPVWSPDGKTIAFSSPGQGAYLARESARSEESAVEPLPAPGPGEPAFVPWSWSADGNEIAGTMGGIAVYSTRDRRYRRLTRSGRDPLWMPGGRRLLFIDGRKVLALDVVTGEATVIQGVEPSDLAGSIGLSRDGGTLYEVLSSTGRDVWMATLGE